MSSWYQLMTDLDSFGVVAESPQDLGTYQYFDFVDTSYDVLDRTAGSNPEDVVIVEAST